MFNGLCVNASDNLSMSVLPAETVLKSRPIRWRLSCHRVMTLSHLRDCAALPGGSLRAFLKFDITGFYDAAS